MIKTRKNKTYHNPRYQELLMDTFLRHGKKFTYPECKIEFGISAVYLIKLWQREYSYVLFYYIPGYSNTYFKGPNLAEHESKIKKHWENFIKTYFNENVMMVSAAPCTQLEMLQFNWEMGDNFEILKYKKLDELR
jgi:hypothetical protein